MSAQANDNQSAAPALVPGKVESLRGIELDMFDRLCTAMVRSSYRFIAWSEIPDWGRNFIVSEFAALRPNERQEELVSKIGTFVDFLAVVSRDVSKMPTDIIRCEKYFVAFRKHPDPARRGFVFKYSDHDKQVYQPRITTSRDATRHAHVYLFRRWQRDNWLRDGYGAVLRAQREAQLTEKETEQVAK